MMNSVVEQGEYMWIRCLDTKGKNVYGARKRVAYFKNEWRALVHT